MEEETEDCRDCNKGLIDFCFNDFSNNCFDIWTHSSVVVGYKLCQCQVWEEDDEAHTKRD